MGSSIPSSAYLHVWMVMEGSIIKLYLVILEFLEFIYIYKTL